MYPRNAATPPRFAIGAVVQISDGAVQTSGVSVVIRAEGGSETAGGGTVSYGASSGLVYYAPTQAETNYTAFVAVAYKTGCIPVAANVITSASSTSGNVVLSSQTHTGAVIPTVSTLTGHTPQTGDSFARIGATGSGLTTITAKTNLIPAAPASTTNITAGTLTTVTNLTNLPAITSNWLTAAGIAAGALDGKGNWNIGKTGYSLTATTGLGNQTANITGNLVGTVSTVTTLTGHTPQTGDSFARIGATGSGLTSLASAADLATATGYIDTEVAAIKAKTDNLPASPAAVSDIPTVAAIADQVWDEAIAGHAGAGSTGEALAGATAPTAAAVADAVWDEAIAGHLTAGSTGEALNAAGAAGDPWVTALPGAYGAGSAGYIVGTNLDAQVSTAGGGLDAAGVRTALGLASANLDTQLGAIDTAVDSILVDTNELQTNQGNWLTATGFATSAALATVDANVDAVLADTNELQTNQGNWLTATGFATSAALATVDTVVDGIKAVTDVLPNGGALTSLATAAALATVDANVDAILVDTAEIGVAGAGLTNINLPDQTMNITGNLSGSVGSVTAGVVLSAAGSATLTEGYRADGAAGTLPQLLYEIVAHLGESSITSTTKTIKQVDGTTTAATFTLNDATTPTSITRAT